MAERVVVGADGVVGGALASALEAARVVHRPPEPGEVHWSQAAELIRSADVVVNSQGTRTLPGVPPHVTDATHGEATRKLLELVRPGALFIHISSASVLGAARRELGPDAPVDPSSFPMPEYAASKARAEQLAVDAAQKGVEVAVLRPAVVYSEPLDGMLATLVNLACGRGVLLEMRPRALRHHFCSGALLRAAARSVVAKRSGRAAAVRYLLADPQPVTNGELTETLSAQLTPCRRLVRIPFVPGTPGAVLRRSFHSSIPRLDLKNLGGVLGVMSMDVRYDVGRTYAQLELDPAEFSRGRQLERVLQRAIARRLGTAT